MTWTERTELLFKQDGLAKLQTSNILVVGLGGVGSYAAECLVRAGVGHLTIVDGDVVDETNINRQLPAMHSTIGKSKVEVMAKRLLDISPELHLTCIQEFLSPERAYQLVSPNYDYVLDCIDSISPKLQLMIAAKRKHIKLVSSMGAGGKSDVSKVTVRDISHTLACPLAKTIRKRLKQEGISKGIKAVYSTERPDASSMKLTDGKNFKKSFYGTNSWMPCLFGLHAASTAITWILNREMKPSIDADIISNT